MELDGIKKIFIWREIWGETIKDQHSKIEFQYNVNSRKVQHQHLLPATGPFEQIFYPKTTYEEHQGVESIEVRCSKKQLLEEVRAVPVELQQMVEILSPKMKLIVGIGELGKFAYCWPSKVVSEKLKETVIRFFHLEGKSGVSNTSINRSHLILFPFMY